MSESRPSPSRWMVFPLTAVLSVSSGVLLSRALPVDAPVTAAAQTTLNQLNEDFIKISGSVTPAVVSIAMSKTVKNQGAGRTNPESPEDFFDQFFNGGPGFPAPDADRKQQGMGSGVIVDAAKGYVLTNNHVVADADEIKVTLTDRRTFAARIIGTDPRTDLAVIQLQNAKNLTQVSFGDSSRLEVGEWVLAIGNPFGLSSTVTAGIISAKGRANVGVADFEDFIQTDAAINPGNSGGALVSIKGELIGVNTAIATRSRGYMGIGFAIPSNMAKQVMESLIAKGKVTRSQLGVFIAQIDEPLAQSLGLKDNRQGIVVTGVVNGSPADQAGLKKYDVILKLQGRSVNDTNQFRNEIALLKPSTQLTIEVLRDGKTMTLKPVLREMQAGQATEPELMAPLPTDKMGFGVAELTPAMRNQLGLSSSLQGVVVSNISNSSQPFEKGLRRGDVITELNRKPMRTTADFEAAVAALKSKDVALLAVQRRDASLIIAFEVK
jgi:serine protease Do